MYHSWTMQRMANKKFEGLISYIWSIQNDWGKNFYYLSQTKTEFLLINFIMIFEVSFREIWQFFVQYIYILPYV